MTIIKIHNVETGEILEREMNADELLQREADEIAQAEAKAKAEFDKTAKAALLEKLGITQDEAKLLLS
jgi:hypothetical protein